MPIPWDKIPWDKILAFAEKMLANCDKTGVPPAQQEKQLRNPDRKLRNHAERVTERGFLRNGGTRTEWRKNKTAIMEKVYDRAANATKDEVKVLRQRSKLHIDLPGGDEDDFEDGGEE